MGASLCPSSSFLSLLFLLRPCSSGSTSLAGLFYLFSSSSPSSLARSLPPYPPRPLSLSLSLSLPFAAAAASLLLLLLLLPLLLPLLVFFVFLPSALSLWPLPCEKSRIRIVTTRREEQRESVGRAGRSGGGAAVSISSEFFWFRLLDSFSSRDSPSRERG